MFTLTNEHQMLLDAAYAYSFDEPPEPEFINDRYEMLYPFIHIVPEKFREPIQSHTLFQQATLMREFQQWCEQTILTVGSKMDASFEKRSALVDQLSDTGRHIFLQSLHDAEILVAKPRNNDFVMLLDTSGGFTVEAIVELTFTNASFDGMLKGYYVYDEIIEHNGRFGLRILSSGGYPFEEATIWFDDCLAQYYYRPSVYVEPNDVDNWTDFVATLNLDDRYVIVEQHAFLEVDMLATREQADGIFAGQHFLGKDYEAAIARIYCATYENPYAHFSEEIAIEDLYAAVFSEDQTLKVRAFNTIFARGEEVADIVNAILHDAPINEEDMYFSIMASHFYKMDLLSAENVEKWDV